MIEEKIIINRNFLERLYKNLEMIPITFDPVFKGDLVTI